MPPRGKEPVIADQSSLFALACAILFGSVFLALLRPRLFGFQVQPEHVVFVGAVLTLATQILPPKEFLEVINIMYQPIIMIAALMVTTSIAENLGVFDSLVVFLATFAKGSGPKLFACLFFGSAVAGMLLTNDAITLIITPIVVDLIDAIATSSWTMEDKIPFYFSVMYAANLVPPIFTGNPINMIAARVFGVRFSVYTAWMGVPAVSSLMISFVGLWFVMRRRIPHEFDMARLHSKFQVQIGQRKGARSGALVLLATLVAFFVGGFFGFRAWISAVAGATFMLAIHKGYRGDPVAPVFFSIGWDVLLFVFCIFTIARGLWHVGVIDYLSRALLSIQSASGRRFFAAYLSGVVSALMNNHPTADIFSMAIVDLPIEQNQRVLLLFSALIGGDLGPKMLPLGSLSTMMWFALCRNKGVQISYRLYILVGIPVASAAILGTVLTLEVEIALSEDSSMLNETNHSLP